MKHRLRICEKKLTSFVLRGVSDVRNLCCDFADSFFVQLNCKGFLCKSFSTVQSTVPSFSEQTLKPLQKKNFKKKSKFITKLSKLWLFFKDTRNLLAAMARQALTAGFVFAFFCQTVSGNLLQMCFTSLSFPLLKLDHCWNRLGRCGRQICGASSQKFQ